ncbi:restriction endonuclease subunit S, partial [Vibrio parahaemolyticus]
MIDQMVTIGDVAEIFDGPHATPKKIEDGPYFLSISSLEGGRIDLSKSAHVSEEQFVKWTKRVTPKKGDLLFSYETRLGEAALMPDGVRACLGRRMGLLRPNLDKVIPEYLLYAYLSPFFQQVIKANTIVGATVDRIALSEMKNFPVRIPSLDEQKSACLLLSAIDKKIELNNRINTELESMARTLYDYWFVQFDFPDAAGEPYKASGGKMIYSDVLKREIPEFWEVKP